MASPAAGWSGFVGRRLAGRLGARCLVVDRGRVAFVHLAGYHIRLALSECAMAISISLSWSGAGFEYQAGDLALVAGVAYAHADASNGRTQLGVDIAQAVVAAMAAAELEL